MNSTALRSTASLVGGAVGSGVSTPISIKLFQNHGIISYLVGFIVLIVGFIGGRVLGAAVDEWIWPFIGRKHWQGEPTKMTWKIFRLVALFATIYFLCLIALDESKGIDLLELSVGTVVVALGLSIVSFGSWRIWCAIVDMAMLVFNLWAFAVTRNPGALCAAWICAVMAVVSILFWTGKLPFTPKEPKPLRPQNIAN